MPKFLLQAAYTPEAWAAMIKNPQDRSKVVAPVIEKLGGSLGETYFAFGEYDVVAIFEMPGNADAAAFAIAAASGGGLKSVKTTPLLTIDEGIDSMRKAQQVSSEYQPPQKT